MKKCLAYIGSIVCHPTFIILVWLALLTLGLCLTACSPFDIPKVPVPVSNHPVPPNLAPEGHILTVAFGLGIAGIVAGIVLFFLIPEQHRVSYGLIAGGAAGLTLDLFLKPAFWFLPYVYLAVAVIGLSLLVYEIWYHYIRNPDAQTPKNP